MKLWEYFKQEAKKCKFFVNIKERISKTTGISKMSIVRVRMEYRKKGGLFTPSKGTNIHKSVLMQTVLTEIPLDGRSIHCTEGRKEGKSIALKDLAKLKNDGVFSRGRT
ncbi:uncharacterized protein [Dysidea avara]|uniref:uncharacterized protein n=1 Tax=Dysidea avara TaxID=196820 RepID=UPI003318432B